MKKTYRPRRNTVRRRRVYRKKSLAAKSGRRMQRIASSYVKKKYTFVTPVGVTGSSDVASITVSHLGGVNSNTTASETITLGACDPDNMLTTDMGLY